MAAPGKHIVAELGFALERDDDELRGRAPIRAEMYVPGTEVLRTSILATWADVICGYLVIGTFGDRVPTTLSLDVHVHEQRPAPDQVLAASRVIKAGRSVVATHVDFTDERGRPMAVATASFMAVPDPAVTLPPGHGDIDARDWGPAVLSRPFAERAGCRRVSPGVALLPRSEDGLNSADTVNGGLIALVIEEAALSAEAGGTLSMMGLRYLRAVRDGPAVASARFAGELATVEVRDAGADDRLCVHAVTRSFPRH